MKKILLWIRPRLPAFPSLLALLALLAVTLYGAFSVALNDRELHKIQAKLDCVRARTSHPHFSAVAHRGMVMTHITATNVFYFGGYAPSTNVGVICIGEGAVAAKSHQMVLMWDDGTELRMDLPTNKWLRGWNKY